MELVRRLELSEAKMVSEFASESLEVAGAIASFGGVGSPISHAVGLGMVAAVTEAQLDEVEAFYRDRGACPVIDLCPSAHPSLSELLGRRCYRITEFNNVLVAAIGPGRAYENAAVGITDNEDVWSRTVAEGFFDRTEFTVEELKLTASLFRTRSGLPWLATVDGEPAAAAGMAIVNRLALLFGGSTIARFRKRGLHTALIQARMAYASAHNCDMVTASTLPGTQSQANYERLGFRVVYTKLILTRDFEPLELVPPS